MLDYYREILLKDHLIVINQAGVNATKSLLRACLSLFAFRANAAGVVPL
jgi:hypothetical protein